MHKQGTFSACRRPRQGGQREKIDQAKNCQEPEPVGRRRQLREGSIGAKPHVTHQPTVHACHSSINQSLPRLSSSQFHAGSSCLTDKVFQEDSVLCSYIGLHIDRVLPPRPPGLPSSKTYLRHSCWCIMHFCFHVDAKTDQCSVAIGIKTLSHLLCDRRPSLDHPAGAGTSVPQPLSLQSPAPTRLATFVTLTTTSMISPFRL